MKYKPSPLSRHDSAPLYPLLVVSYFFLHLCAENLNKGLRFELLLKPYVFALAVTLLLWLLLAWSFKSFSKGAFLAFFLAFLFFSYGHFRNLLLVYAVGFLIPQKICIGFFLFFGVLLPGYFMVKSRSDFKKWTVYLNIFSSILLFFPLSRIASHSLYPSVTNERAPEPMPIFTKAPQALPDIYYILLDEYAREDILESELHFNNAPFLKALKDRGFFIAGKSHSNYLQTSYSLSSSLNMRYVQFDEDFPSLIKENLVSRTLKHRLGYRYIFVNSGCIMSDASLSADELISTVGGNDVELMLANTTMINAFTAFFFSESWRYRHRYNFEHIAQVPFKPGPKFIMAHILLPHPPFVFNEDGGPVQSETIRFTPMPFNVANYHKAYPGQVAYTNTLVLKLVDELISKSQVPPIIILQSDHGMDPVDPDLPTVEYIRKRSANFTAMLLPEQNTDGLDHVITPVNIFRQIFTRYFGADLPDLPDEIFDVADTEDGTGQYLKAVEGILPSQAGAL